MRDEFPETLTQGDRDCVSRAGSDTSSTFLQVCRVERSKGFLCAQTQ